MTTKADEHTTPLARGAAEARAVAEQAAALLDAEWKRLRATLEGVTLPPQVQSAVDRFDEPVRQTVDRLEGLVATARREIESSSNPLTRNLMDGLDDLRGRVDELSTQLVDSGRKAADRFGIPVYELRDGRLIRVSPDGTVHDGPAGSPVADTPVKTVTVEPTPGDDAPVAAPAEEPAGKAVPTEPAAKKAAPRKAAAKKVPARKTAPKKAAARKTTAKKAAPKRTAAGGTSTEA